MRNLNFRHLLYFWNVAKQGHLTKAAGHLRVSQSALSAQIRELEQYLGRPLFERAGKKLVLTEFGTEVLEYAEAIFGLGQELMATVRGGTGQAVQHIKIGAVATLSRNFMENLLKPLLIQRDLHLSLESGSLEELLKRLATHHLDVVFSNKPVVAEANKHWRCVRVARQAVCIVGPRTIGKARFRLPADLVKARMVLPGLSSDIRTQFDIWCATQQIQVQPVAEVDDMAMLRLLARDSGALAVLPEVVVQDELRDGRLKRYGTIPGVFENFYAISMVRRRPAQWLQQLIKKT